MEVVGRIKKVMSIEAGQIML